MKQKYTKISFFFLCLFFSFLSSEKAQAAYNYEGVAFYAPSSQSTFIYEGIAFYAPKTQVENSLPVYRFQSDVNTDYFYTISESEKTTVENNTAWGYIQEETTFYAFSSQIEGTLPVYRFYSGVNGDHFYTISENEKTIVENNPAWGYTYEGIAFYAYPSQLNSSSPIYRFYSNSRGSHFYTASEEEKNNNSIYPVYRFYSSINSDHFYTISKDENSTAKTISDLKYSAEGIAFYAFENKTENTLPVYRFYSGVNGDHFYTISENEKTIVENNPAWGYAYEGIAFYAYENQVNNSLPVYRFYSGDNGDHFYTASESEKNNLTLSTLGPEIAVGLWNYGSKNALKDNPFKITANKKYNIKNKDGKIIASINGGTETRVTYDSDSYLKAYGSISSTRSKKIFYFDAADGDNSNLIFDVHRPSSDYDQYRGKIKIQYTDSSNIWVINTLPLEHYVWGDGELAGTGDIEHTKTMTTIFRTYGYWYIKYATKYNAYGFKIKSDSGNQIYRGYDWEKNHTNIKTAAQSTRGVIATYSNDVALTPYCSWSAGKTRSFKEVWGSDDYPWCKSVSDPYGNYNADYWEHGDTKTQAELIAAGNHMVGLIAHGSLYLAEEKDWAYNRIMKYYFSGITLGTTY